MIDRLQRDLNNERRSLETVKEQLDVYRKEINRREETYQQRKTQQDNYHQELIELERHRYRSEVSRLEHHQSNLKDQVARLKEEGAKLRQTIDQLRGEQREGGPDEDQTTVAMAEAEKLIQELKVECSSLRQQKDLLGKHKEFVLSNVQKEHSRLMELKEERHEKEIDAFKAKVAKCESTAQQEAQRTAETILAEEKQKAVADARAEAAATMQQDLQRMTAQVATLENTLRSKELQLQQCQKQLSLALSSLSSRKQAQQERQGEGEEGDKNDDSLIVESNTEDQASLDQMRERVQQSREQSQARLRELMKSQAQKNNDDDGGSTPTRGGAFGLGSKPLFGMRGNRDDDKDSNQ